MLPETRSRIVVIAPLAALAALMFLAGHARGHCDTADGPVVAAGRSALESGDPTPALRWVRPADEAPIRDALQRARAVRKQGDEAKSLADQFFLETLVRIHRTGEGEPFTGIRPAGAEVDPAVAAADRALDGGNPDALIGMLIDRVTHGIRARFAAAADAKKHADQSIESGRRWVRMYVELIHYVERIHDVASSSPASAHDQPHAAGDGLHSANAAGAGK